jgi:MDMPI C-terminal domain
MGEQEDHLASRLVCQRLEDTLGLGQRRPRPAWSLARRGHTLKISFEANDLQGNAACVAVQNQQADVTVTGPAQSLLLILTRRRPLTDREATGISVDGDTDLAQHWIDNTSHVSG